MRVRSEAPYVNVSTAEMLLSRTTAATGVCSYDLRRIPLERSTKAPAHTYDEVHYVAKADQVRTCV